MTTNSFSADEYSAAFLIDFLATLGVRRAELSFSGGGDSGAVDHVEFTYVKKRRPTDEAVTEQWLLALARHHLLYPEYKVELPPHAGKGEKLLAALVEKHFDDHINSHLGDWYNNEGGRGNVAVDIAERAVRHEVCYNTTSHGEPHTAKANHPDLFTALVAAANLLGVGSIEVELDFDSEGYCWSQTLTFHAIDGAVVVLDESQQTALLAECNAVLRVHSFEGKPLGPADSMPELALGFYETFVKEPALKTSADEVESFAVSYTIGPDTEQLFPSLEWTATFCYHDTDDGDSGEVIAPVIGPTAKRARRSRRRAA